MAAVPLLYWYPDHHLAFVHGKAWNSSVSVVSAVRNPDGPANLSYCKPNPVQPKVQASQEELPAPKDTSGTEEIPKAEADIVIRN